MSKFCGNCGTELPDDALVCGNCGTRLVAENKRDDKKIKKFLPIAAIAAAVLVLIIIICSVSGGNSPKSVAKKYVNAMFEPDVEALYDCLYVNGEQYAKYMADAYDMTVKEYLEEECDASSLKELYKNYNKELKELYESFIGDNLKVKIEDIEVVEYSKKELKELKEDYESKIEKYEDFIGWDEDDIKAACDVTLTAIIIYDDDENEEEMTLTMVKVKGNWKILLEPSSVSF